MGVSCRHAPQLGCLPARIGNQEACSTKPFCLSDAWTIPLISAQGQPAIGPLRERPDGFGLDDWYLAHQWGGRSMGNELRGGGSIRSPTMWVSRSENLGKKLGKAARAGIAIVCPSCWAGRTEKAEKMGIINLDPAGCTVSFHIQSQWPVP